MNTIIIPMNNEVQSDHMRRLLEQNCFISFVADLGSLLIKVTRISPSLQSMLDRLLHFSKVIHDPLPNHITQHGMQHNPLSKTLAYIDVRGCSVSYQSQPGPQGNSMHGCDAPFTPTGLVNKTFCVCVFARHMMWAVVGLIDAISNF